MTRTDIPIQRDLDAARLQLIRRRVIVFVYVVAVLLIGLSLLAELALKQARRPTRIVALGPALGGVVMIIMASIRLRRQRRAMSLRDLIRRTTMFVVVTIAIQIPTAELTARAVSQILRNAGLVHVQIGALIPLLLSMLCIHVAASVILPWSLWESARPVLIIVGIALLMAPFAPEGDSWPARFGTVLALFVFGLPGMLLCWLRFSRLREVVAMRFLSTRYDEVQRELAYARRIHEKLFPRPISDGPLRFDYRYEPMRQIGGDFVDLVRGEDESLTIVLVDVTGHGIAAALAVNRLHGEIKRTLAQIQSRPRGAADICELPARIVASLNEYVHLTLADESVFGTALAVTIDPARHTLTWVNAGHPPAFLCRAGGAIEMLDATAMMLGPSPPDAFESEPCSCEFGEDDVLIAYTDGGIEARGRDDAQLGITGLRGVVESARRRPAGSMLDAIMSGIANFRAGAPEDDTLVLAVSGAGRAVTPMRQQELRR